MGEMSQEEEDAIEAEAYRDLKREEAIEQAVAHDVHEPTTYELAEVELKAQEKIFLRTYENRNNN